MLMPASALLMSGEAVAACQTNGSVITCSNGINTATVGTGRTENNVTVEVLSGGQINSGNATAISIGDNGFITVRNGGTVSNHTDPSGQGLFGTGPNTVEFGSNGRLVVEQGGSVIATGSNHQAEAVNVHGFGNTVINHGLIEGETSAAIWFQDEKTGAKNTVDNYGIIQKLGSGSVIGTSGSNGINFINRSGAQVIGDLSFSNGNDILTFEANSIVTGNINGGGGTNDLILQGINGSSDVLAGALNNFTTLTKDGDGLWTVSGSLAGFTNVSVKSGTLALTGNNAAYTGVVLVQSGGTLEARAQSLPTKAIAADNTNNVQNDGLVRFTQPDDGTYIGQIVGSGALEKTGSGVLTLSPSVSSGNTYSGGTKIDAGTIAIAADNALGNTTGGLVLDGGELRLLSSFNLAQSRNIVLGSGGGAVDTNGNDTTISQAVSGSGGLVKKGAGTLSLEGANTYQGDTTVARGTLYVNGNQTAAIGNTRVENGAAIGGVGTIGGDLLVADGALLSPGRAGTAPGRLTINGNLDLSGGSILQYRFGQANVPGGPLNDLTVVHGNLVLDGTINVTATGGSTFDPGVYRVISYDGTLSDNGLAIGVIPSSGYYVQTAVANQVNLVNTNGLNLTFWDAWPAGNGALGDNAVTGGTGTWQSSASGATNINWTEQTGAINAPYQDDAFAIFMANGGTVTVDESLGAVRAAGMQFASDGYHLTGDGITLVGNGASVVRVGDGTAVGVGFTATISSVLSGNTQLTKTDLGTLILEGVNLYTGGTAINGGVLQVSSNANLGDAAGDVYFDGGTLRTTQSFAIDRAAFLGVDGGTIDTVGGTTLAYEGVLDGSGHLTKTGDGVLILARDNGYIGGTAINGGTIQISSDAQLGVAQAPLNINGGTLHTTSDIIMNRVTVIGAGNANFQTDAGTQLSHTAAISGTGSLTKSGDGNLLLVGEGTYTGGTIIAAGSLQLGDGGTTGSILGDVLDNGILSFNRSDDIEFSGRISGTGQVKQIGKGKTTLNAQSIYSGETRVTAGTLAAGGDSVFSPKSDFFVESGAALALSDHSQIVKSLSNSGLVDFGTDAGTILTVLGNYSQNDGRIVLGTALSNDDSATDRLVINGDATGEGVIKINNVGGPGAPTREGIKIVDIGGASNAIFRLSGDYEFQGAGAVVGGAYAYQLYKNGIASADDGNWYLRSVLPGSENQPVPDDSTPGTPLYQAGVPSYEAYPQLLLGLNSLPTLQQRVGNRYWSNAGNMMVTEGADPIGSPYAAANEAGSVVDGNGVWGRIEGNHSKVDPRVSTSDTNFNYNIFRLQAGLDGVLTETETGKLIGGVTVHYAHGKGNTTSLYGDSEIATNGYGFGGNLTWYGDNGFYLDGQSQVTWYRSDLNSDLANLGLADNNHGLGFAISAEAGKRIAVAQNWFVTPQGQLSYSRISFDAFNDAFNARVSLDSGQSLQGRLGLAVENQQSWQNDKGFVDRTSLYAVGNLYYEFLDGSKVDVAGTGFASRDARMWGGLGFGGSYNWDSDKYSVYGEGSVNTSLENFGGSYSYKGTVGLRVKF